MYLCTLKDPGMKHLSEANSLNPVVTCCADEAILLPNILELIK